MIEIGKGPRVGYPWHGIYYDRLTTIQLPGGNKIDGIPYERRPTLTDYSLHGAGDVYKVAIPGIPEITPSVTDTAAGKTWLNYALLSGFGKVLYGKQLGERCWIYIAPDHSRWLARLEYNAATDTGTLTFKPFGIVGTSILPIAQTVTINGMFGVTGAPFWMIDDIKPESGAGIVAVAFEENSLSSSTGFIFRNVRNVLAGREVVISGIPPSASASLGLHVPNHSGPMVTAPVGSNTGTRTNIQGSQMWREWLPPSGESSGPTFVDTSIFPGSGSYYAVLSGYFAVEYRDTVVGLAYIDGAASAVTMDCDMQSSTIGDGGTLVQVGSGWAVESATTTNNTFEITLRFGTQSLARTGAAEISVTTTLAGTSTSVDGEWAGDTSDVVTGIDYVQYCTIGLGADGVAMVRRFSNSAYGLFDVINGASRHIGTVTPWDKSESINPTGVDAPWGYWATVHPVTHQLIQDERAVVFV